MTIQSEVKAQLRAMVKTWRIQKHRNRPEGYWDRILSVDSDAKTVKGRKKGYLTGILYLAPSDMSGLIDTCAFASKGCKSMCLVFAGRSATFAMINERRIAKTAYMLTNQFAFLASIAYQIESLVRRARKERLTPAVRLNGTSDLPWLALFMAELFPAVQFYDYTKYPNPWKRTRANYHLTFSHSEVNLSACLDALSHGVNVAVVFGTKKSQPLPSTWNGYPVVSGDDTDLRFLDRKGVVIGLYAKGRAKGDCSGFVVRQTLVTIAPLLRVA